MSGEQGTDLSGVSADALLPRRIRGYDVDATEVLIGELTARRGELERECAALRERVSRLEAELADGPEREEQASRTLIAATSQAAAIKKSARREAKELVSQAREEAEKRAEEVDRLEGDREEVEREVARLRRIQRAVHAGLKGFLTEAVEQLRAEQVDEELDPTANPDGTLMDATNTSPEPSGPG